MAETTTTEPPIYKGLNIYQRLNQVQGEVDYIQKEKKSEMKYSIVSHDAVTAKVRPLMVKWGVIYFPSLISRTQDGTRTQVDAVIRFQNIDDPLDGMDVYSCGYGIDSQDKGPGKAISYAVKYALLKALGLESGDDPDEDQKTEHSPAGLLDIERQIPLAETEADLKDLAKDLRALGKSITPAQFQATGTKLKMKAKELGINPA